MGALPAARIEPRPLPAEAVENAIRAARKTGQVEGRGERILERDWPATPGGMGVRTRQTEVREE